MTKHTIGFIGAGNMARSLASGLIHNGWSADRILLSDPNLEARDSIHGSLGVGVTADNSELAGKVDILVLAVKPQVLREVAVGIAPAVQDRQPLVISIAAGIRSSDIERWLGGNLALVRVMPNTAALIGSGASGLYANPRADEAARNTAESILRAVGVVAWVRDEAQLDIVTALSGSGPAYFFLVIEALEQAAIDQGLPADTARLLALETAFGASKMALESDEEPALLRQQVTSKGGTTEAALGIMEQRGLRSIYSEALAAAVTRAQELAELLGKE